MTAPQLTISRHQQPTRGRYAARLEGLDGEGQLAYSRTSKSLIIAEHTRVDDGLRGRGVALALGRRVVGGARSGGGEIYAPCPHATAARRTGRGGGASVLACYDL